MLIKSATAIKAGKKFANVGCAQESFVCARKMFRFPLEPPATDKKRKC